MWLLFLFSTYSGPATIIIINTQSYKFCLCNFFHMYLLHPIPITSIIFQKFIIITWAQKFPVVSISLLLKKISPFSAYWFKTQLFSLAFRFSYLPFKPHLFIIVIYVFILPTNSLVSWAQHALAFRTQLMPLAHWINSPASGHRTKLSNHFLHESFSDLLYRKCVSPGVISRIRISVSALLHLPSWPLSIPTPLNWL